MDLSFVDSGIELMKRERYGEALHFFRRALDIDPHQWNVWYMAGQCHRLLNEIDAAILHLSRAAELKENEPGVLLGLGIALQIRERWDEAVDAFRRAIEADSEFELAYNSLAYTQQKRGQLDKALHNYNAGAEALTRRLVKGLNNNPSNPILIHPDTTGQHWVQYAEYGAMYLSALASSRLEITRVAFPTSESAVEEQRTQRHAGLYWSDVKDESSTVTRTFLPNYLNTFWERLRAESSYAILIANQGITLQLLGRNAEAESYFDEASEFQS
jgi:tetratricopeptide (TPR) repeat protein